MRHCKLQGTRCAFTPLFSCPAFLLLCSVGGKLAVHINFSCNFFFFQMPAMMPPMMPGMMMPPRLPAASIQPTGPVNYPEYHTDLAMQVKYRPSHAVSSVKITLMSRLQSGKMDQFRINTNPHNTCPCDLSDSSRTDLLNLECGVCLLPYISTLCDCLF